MSQGSNIKGGYPMRVDQIVFDDGTTMNDKVVIICGGFIIIDEDENAPSMYNLNTITKLIRVEEIRPKARIGAW